MAKLHELLAVENSLETQANKVRTDLLNTFDKKVHLFNSKVSIFTPLKETESEVVESQSDIQTSVNKELNWVSQHIVKALDASFQVADANTKAKADIILDDDDETVLATGVPATSLLELEKRMAEIHALVTAIPTLDPAKGFVVDSSRENTYIAREVVKNRTKKTTSVLVKYQATKEHPAQTELVSEDVVVGKIREQEWSSLITPAQKSEMINRVEMVARAVRRARSRANEVEIDKTKKVGTKLMDYILGK